MSVDSVLVVEGRIVELRVQHAPTDVPEVYEPELVIELDVHQAWRIHPADPLGDWRLVLGVRPQFRGEPSLVAPGLYVGQYVVVLARRWGSSWRIRALDVVRPGVRAQQAQAAPRAVRRITTEQ